MTNKLYAIKDETCGYLNGYGNWNKTITLDTALYPTREEAERELYHGGYVVTIVEEPKRVEVSADEAKILNEAMQEENLTSVSIIDEYLSHLSHCNFEDITRIEHRLLKALVNGFTVAKEKRYFVKVPYTDDWHFQKYSKESKMGAKNGWKPFPVKDTDMNINNDLFLFTYEEICFFGLDDCERKEVKDNE